MKVVLHIGLHKTGSTAIQTMLSVNRAALRRLGINYADAGFYAVGHHFLGWKLQSPKHDAMLRKLGCEAPDGESILGAMLEETDRRKCGTLLVSSETLSSIQSYDPRRIADALRGHDVTVIAYVRRQDRFLESRYNQGVKSPPLGGQRFTAPLNAFIEEELAGGALDYEMAFGRWAAAFGRSRVQAHLYERSRLAGGDVVRHFCRVAALPEDSIRFDTQDRNTSLDGHCVRFLRRLNRIALTEMQRQRAIDLSMQYIRKAGGPTHGYLLGLAEREALLGRFAESNRRFCRDFLGDERALELSAAERERLVALEPDLKRDRFLEILGFVMPELLKLEAAGAAAQRVRTAD